MKLPGEKRVDVVVHDSYTAIMNNGVLIPILRYSTFNWTSLPAATEDIIIAENVPVVPFARVGLSLRVHKLRLSAGVTMSFLVRGINPSSEDGADFVFATDLGATPGITSSTPVPSLQQLSSIISDVQHPMVRVLLRTVSTGATAVNVAIFSADLVMRVGS
jgi:hypothetical protein